MDLPHLLAQLTETVTALAALPVDALEHEELKALAVGAEASAQRLRAVGSQALGQVDESATTDRERKETSWWYRDALGISGEAAGLALRRARGLRSLPAITAASVEGTLSLDQAGALVPLVGKLDPAFLDAVEPDLVVEAAPRTVDGIGLMVRELIAAHSEDALEQEQAIARDRRYWRYRLGADGMVHGSFALPAEDAESLYTTVEAKSAKQGSADTRLAHQRRADAVVEVFDAATRWDDLPVAGGQRAQVSFVMGGGWASHGSPVCDVPAAQAGSSESHGRGLLRGTCLTCGGGAVVVPEPPTGAWTGPQTQARMERILCDARISRVLLSPAGQILSLESLNDDITLAQRRAVSARDRCCVARGCKRPPAYCELHHLRSRQDDGATTVGNLALLCTRHHTMWHLGVITLRDLHIPWWQPTMSYPELTPSPDGEPPEGGGQHQPRSASPGRSDPPRVAGAPDAPDVSDAPDEKDDGLDGGPREPPGAA